MFHRSHIPAPPLGNFVEQFWLCSDTTAHGRPRILPNGTIELVFNLREDRIRIEDPGRPGRERQYSGAVVAGAYGRFFVIDHTPHASIVGVHFRPGGAFPFLGVPASELADTHVDLEALWGRPAMELRERLSAATTPIARFFLLEQALSARLARTMGTGRTIGRHAAVPRALDAFEQNGASVRVSEVARRVGLCQRRLIQVFAAEVGLTPKRYGRVRRFQRALELVRDMPSPDWARVGAECGHFDQSHLIRDFRAFSGLTPEEYLRRRSEPVVHNHVLQNG